MAKEKSQFRYATWQQGSLTIPDKRRLETSRAAGPGDKEIRDIRDVLPPFHSKASMKPALSPERVCKNRKHSLHQALVNIVNVLS